MKHKQEILTAVLCVLLAALVLLACARAELVKQQERAEAERNVLHQLQARIDELEQELEAERQTEHVVVTEEYKPLPVDYATVPDTEIDETDAVLLAKVLWGEYRQNDYEQRAAVCWCVLNRADESGQSIEAVLTAPGQFDGFSYANPVDADLYAVAVDVLARHAIEDCCIGSVGRVLPESFKWFDGNGRYNTFRNAYRGGEVIVP